MITNKQRTSLLYYIYYEVVLKVHQKRKKCAKKKRKTIDYKHVQCTNHQSTALTSMTEQNTPDMMNSNYLSCKSLIAIFYFLQ